MATKNVLMKEGLTYYHSKMSAKMADDIAAAVASAGGVDPMVVSALPATGEAKVLYFVPNSGSGNNSMDEYMWVNKGTTENPNFGFEKVGSTGVDLTNYLQDSDVVGITNSEIDELFTPATP